jgi:hypothetical protein
MPLGTITLSVTFGDQVHYLKETLYFEVIDFEGPYHTILGRPCYAKFMAIPVTPTSSSRCQVPAVSSPSLAIEQA